MQLIDGFQTAVTGPIVDDHQLAVSVSSENCEISGSADYLPLDMATGKVAFDDLYYVGKNGTSCKMTIYLHSSASSGIAPLQCMTLLMGCPGDEDVVDHGDYDACQDLDSGWAPNITGLLLTLVGILGCLLLIIIVTAAVMYGIYLKRVRREYEISHAEIPDLSRAKSTTLEGKQFLIAMLISILTLCRNIDRSEHPENTME